MGTSWASGDPTRAAAGTAGRVGRRCERFSAGRDFWKRIRPAGASCVKGGDRFPPASRLAFPPAWGCITACAGRPSHAECGGSADPNCSDAVVSAYRPARRRSPMIRFRVRAAVAVVTAVLAVSAACAGRAAEIDRQGVAFFERKIRPVLVRECFRCHATSAKEVKGGLLLDSEQGMLTGGESGPAIVPGKPEESLLMDALRHDGLEMPPGKKLDDAVIAAFGKWIRMGAPVPKSFQEVAGGAKPAGWTAKKTIDWEAEKQFWSFRPIQDPPVPHEGDPGWPKDDLDWFVQAGHLKAGVRPVADAEPRVLIRRLYFDLIGLPPTPEAIDAFEAACRRDRDAAVAELVDRLLASPQFGEHWGRHWLDVARYAESNGNVDNELFPYAWRYRDWVIDAFNADMPFDRFITEQLAGDLLPADTPQQRNRQLIATGFLALTSKPRPQNNPDYLLDLVADQIDVTTVAFMGLTVACARCHDHKFDPIPTAEYYRLAAIFESTVMMHGSKGRRGNAKDPRAAQGLIQLASTDQAAAEALRAHEERLQALRRRVSELRERRDRLQKQLKQLQKAPKGGKSDRGKATARIDSVRRQLKLVGKQLASAQKDLAQARKNGPGSADVCMGVLAGKPVTGRIRIRGDATKPGEVVGRGFPTIGYVGTPPQIPDDANGRLELARWIASPNNTLTARVIVNRIWRHLFGRGIVPSVDNFGHLGEPPSHPELLDHLATRFMRDGWSVKRMIRTIVLSRTYQLSSDHDPENYEKDPDNVYLWRHNVRRLQAEELRDALLAVAGTLDLKRPVGSIVQKYGNILVQNGNQSLFRDYEAPHRSVYLPIVRQAEPAMLKLFDFPDPELVVGDRSTTNVPAQSLFLMNSPFMLDQATALSARVLAHSTDDEDRIDWLYRVTLGRHPQPRELRRLLEFLTEPASGKTPQQRWRTVCHTLLASAEFRYVE
ncbi:MAG: DUF1553 domain-containing protein [Planctomycetota bacterium]|nr:MAG: DUF1553 domain-containing protein [Planctomycetota bacterium]